MPSPNPDTTVTGFPSPIPADPPDVPGDMKALAQKVTDYVKVEHYDRRRTITQNIPDDTETIVNWTQPQPPPGWTQTASDTVVDEPGIYSVCMLVTWGKTSGAPNPDGYAQIGLFIAGQRIIVARTVLHPDNQVSQEVTWIGPLSGGDIVKLKAWQRTGATARILGSSDAQAGSYLSVTRLNGSPVTT